MIGISEQDGVVTLELQRPEKRNALNTVLCRELLDGVEQAVEQRARVVVLTGQGTAFCAGADLSGDAYSADFYPTLTKLLGLLQTAPLPVVAAVNGPAIGAGMQLAMAADLRVVDESARFSVPAAKLGVTVDRWTVRRLAELAGGGVARSLLLTTEPLYAAEAVASGFATRTGDLAAAQEFAAGLAKLAPLSLQHMKMTLNDDGTRAEMSEELTKAFYAAWLSADAQEAAKARAEKREPVFRGA